MERVAGERRKDLGRGGSTPDSPAPAAPRPPVTPLCVTGTMDERGSGLEPGGSTPEPIVSNPLVTHVGVAGTVPRGE